MPKPPNDVFQPSPQTAVRVVSFNAARGPAERGRWAPSPQSLTSEVAHARNLVRCAIRPLRLSPHAKASCTDDQPAVAITRLGMVSKHLTAVERMRGEQPGLAERPS